MWFDLGNATGRQFVSALNALYLDLGGPALEGSPESAGQAARFHTRSGLLSARRRKGWIELDFPAEPAAAAEPPSPVPSRGPRIASRRTKATARTAAAAAAFGGKIYVIGGASSRERVENAGVAAPSKKAMDLRKCERAAAGAPA